MKEINQKLENMVYVNELAQKHINNFTNTITPYPPDETLIYINIAGQNNNEIINAFECIYFDDQRNFNIVDIKKQDYLLTALIVMSSNTSSKPIKF